MNPDLLNRAIELEEQGEPHLAAAICKQILAVAPRNGQAWFVLGRAAMQAGEVTAAVTALTHAANLLADLPDVHLAQGNALQAASAHQDAVAAYDRALRLRPNDGDALFERGNALFHLGHLADAAASLRQAVRVSEGDAEIHFMLGETLYRLGQPLESLAALDRATTLNPRHLEAFHIRGEVFRQLRQYDRALADQNQALTLSPGNWAVLNNRALTHKALGQPNQAAADFRQAIQMNGTEAGLHRNLGQIYLTLERPMDAQAAFERAIALAPGQAANHVGRATALMALGHVTGALAAAEAALAVAPADIDALLTVGNALHTLHRPDDALAAYSRVLEIQPDHADALNNTGNTLQTLGRMTEALRCYEQALALAPDRNLTILNRGYCRLKMGQWPDAWRDYEARWHDKLIAASFPIPDAPRWTGAEDIDGRSILVPHEQGFGDTLQFCRYGSLLAARGAKIILEVPAALTRLLGRMDGISAVIVQGSPRPVTDFFCPMMSLPLAFGTTPGTVPADRYFCADAASVAAWRRHLDERTSPGRRVGLVWAGASRHHSATLQAIDRRRSIPLSAFAPLAQIPGITLISLQNGDPARQAPSGLGLYDPTHRLTDFADTADLIEALDLVITVDTAVAHLAGGLGKPVWILNRFDACWRWLEDRTDTPWYPSARLFRQRTPGDWAGVIADVAAALRD